LQEGIQRAKRVVSILIQFPNPKYEKDSSLEEELKLLQSTVSINAQTEEITTVSVLGRGIKVEELT
jgi:hypothetical protein